eukprot:9139517-Pyramimonas_sp.AAC.1
MGFQQGIRWISSGISWVQRAPVDCRRDNVYLHGVPMAVLRNPMAFLRIRWMSFGSRWTSFGIQWIS